MKQCFDNTNMDKCAKENFQVESKVPVMDQKSMEIHYFKVEESETATDCCLTTQLLVCCKVLVGSLLYY